MSLHAFYIDPQEWSEQLILSPAEAEHARVLRLKQGMEVLALDGRGRSAHCVVEQINKKAVQLKIINEKTTPPPRAKAIMALALSKIARRSFFMEKASEFCAWEIWLWQADHSQGKLVQAVADACKNRLIAGLKQCHNLWLPEIKIFENIGTVAEVASQADWRYLPWEEQGKPPAMLTLADVGKEGTTIFVIGPEGGFSQAEIDKLKAAAFLPVSLGNHILRCETAAALCLGLHWWASQLPGAPDCKVNCES